MGNDARLDIDAYSRISRSFLNISLTIIYHWKAEIEGYTLVVIVLYYTIR